MNACGDTPGLTGKLTRNFPFSSSSTTAGLRLNLLPKTFIRHIVSRPSLLILEPLVCPVSTTLFEPCLPLVSSSHPSPILDSGTTLLNSYKKANTSVICTEYLITDMWTDSTFLSHVATPMEKAQPPKLPDAHTAAPDRKLLRLLI